ncbi:uncharacterized protein LOC125546204 [Triticum urartu]|uniref:uncharacterized protein LOC125546143 n=1 Tax=Triticum urartu TaxID=4572 RepID=UPI002042D017|nr:uncharacterized protein LOC125546143 [Triticum urartu]XP_048566332.1 uncharacterized protein LOC125546204 [Triticum urartu]
MTTTAPWPPAAAAQRGGSRCSFSARRGGSRCSSAPRGGGSHCSSSGRRGDCRCRSTARGVSLRLQVGGPPRRFPLHVGSSATPAAARRTSRSRGTGCNSELRMAPSLLVH